MIDVTEPDKLFQFIMSNVLSLEQARQYVPELSQGQDFSSVRSVYHNGTWYYRNGGEFHTTAAIGYFSGL